FYGGQENGPFSNPSPGFNPPFFSIQSFNTNCGASSANPGAGQLDCSIPDFNVLANGFPATSLSDPNTPLLYSLDPHLVTPYNQVANYNSLQARLETRLTRGLQFQGSYTYGHALDNASSASLGSFASGDFRDQRFPKLEYGNADFDVRHRFVLSYSYELPFGKGKAFGGNASGVLDQIVGGWEIAGIITASTGNYFTATDIATNLSNSDGGGTVANGVRPNRVGDPNSKPCIPGALFNTCAFASNTVLGTFGNAGRNIIRGPGLQKCAL